MTLDSYRLRAYISQGNLYNYAHISVCFIIESRRKSAATAYTFQHTKSWLTRYLRSFMSMMLTIVLTEAHCQETSLHIDRKILLEALCLADEPWRHTPLGSWGPGCINDCVKSYDPDEYEIWTLICTASLGRNMWILFEERSMQIFPLWA